MEKIEFKPFKKTGIVMFHGRLISRRHNGYMTNEILPFLRTYFLEEIGREVCDFITEIKTFDNVDRTYYKDITEVDINDYDEIIIFNSVLYNLFGGIMIPCSVKTFKQLLKFKGDIWYYLDDPEYGYFNISQFLIDKYKRGKLKFLKGIKLTEKEMLKYEQKVHPRVNVIWAGLDYIKYTKSSKMYSHQPHNAWTNIMMAPYIFLKKNEIYKDYPFEREFDVMYYGKKKKDRIRILDSYFKNNTSLTKYWLGYNPGEEYNLKHLNASGISRDLLIDELCKGYSTLVLGSKAHNGNLISPRYLECMNSDIISFIHYAYDDGTIIKDKYLRDFLIVKNIKEYQSKLNKVKKSEKLFREIVAAQRNEITNGNYITLKNNSQIVK